MRTLIEALKEIRDRLTYFCLRIDGKYNPPWATELVGIIDEAVTDSHAVGNAAAMRESLVKIRGIAKTFMEATRMRRVTDSARIDVGGIEELANAALAAPPRNCDVGTPEEQEDRFDSFCKRHVKMCKECPVRPAYGHYCHLSWAQMPYGEGGAK